MNGTKRPPERLVWIKTQVPESVHAELKRVAKMHERTPMGELRIALQQHLKAAA